MNTSVECQQKQKRRANDRKVIEYCLPGGKFVTVTAASVMCVSFRGGRLCVAVQEEDEELGKGSGNWVPSLNHHGGRVEQQDFSVEQTVQREVCEETGGLVQAPVLHRKHAVYLDRCKQLLFVEDTSEDALWQALPRRYQERFQGRSSAQMGEVGVKKWSRAATHQMWLPLQRSTPLGDHGGYWSIDTSCAQYQRSASRLKVALKDGLQSSTHLLDAVLENHTECGLTAKCEKDADLRRIRDFQNEFYRMAFLQG